MRSLIAGLAVLAAIVAGCTPGASASPQIIYVTQPPTVTPLVSPTPEPTPGPTSGPTPEPTAWSCEAPTASSYYCAVKSGEGGHGGPPLLDLPKAIAMDYRVSGSCVFSLGLAMGTPDVGLSSASPSLILTVSGPEVAGTWRVSIKPGRYYPVIGEAVGCIYGVNVRDDR